MEDDEGFYDWDDDDENDIDPESEWVLDCGNANCCMNFAPHYRSECYTPEDYEAFVAEMEAEQDPTSERAP
jgi:hypothetical protein